MTRIVKPIIFVALFLTSCMHERVIRNADGVVINQHTKEGLKTGIWIEKDSVSTIIGINDYYKDSMMYHSDPPAIKSKYYIKWTGWDYYPVTATGRYNRDKRDGEWQYKIGDTTIVKKIFYSNNTLDSIYLYNRKGKLVMQGHTDWEKDEFIYKAEGNSGKFPLYFLNTNQNWNWILR